MGVEICIVLTFLIFSSKLQWKHIDVMSSMFTCYPIRKNTTKQDGLSFQGPFTYGTQLDSRNECVWATLCLPDTVCLRVSGRVSIKLSEQKEKIQRVGVCVECAGITKWDGEASPAHVFLGHLRRCEWRDLREGEEWLAHLSLWGIEQNRI